MAAFKVGDRVKVVAAHRVVPGSAIRRLGKVGVITEIGHSVDFPIGVYFDDSDNMVFNPCELSPLLPPDDAADQFIARIKKLGSEPVNDAPKVTVREGK